MSNVIGGSLSYGTKKRYTFLKFPTFARVEMRSSIAYKSTSVLPILKPDSIPKVKKMILDFIKTSAVALSLLDFSALFVSRRRLDDEEFTFR